MSYNKTLYFILFYFLGGGRRGEGGGEGGGRTWRTRTRLKMKTRTRRPIFMSKVRDNSAPKMILGAGWGARDRLPFLAKAAQLM